MLTFTNILVATDFSPASDAALAQAWRLASQHGASLNYLHVVPKGGSNVPGVSEPDGGQDDEANATQQALEYMDNQLRAIGASGQSIVRFGRPLAEIEAVAKDANADLLVIGATGENGKRWGTVSSRCVRKGPSRVLLVPAAQTAPFKRVLTCVDLSDSTQSVLQLAMGMAATDDADLTAVHCFEVPWERARFGTGVPSNALELTDEYQASLQRQYQAMASLGDTDAAPPLKLLQAIDPGAAIVRYASESETDLVVTGTTSRTGLAYMLLGTTAEKIMRDTSCAVLSIKTPA